MDEVDRFIAQHSQSKAAELVQQLGLDGERERATLNLQAHQVSVSSIGIDVRAAPKLHDHMVAHAKTACCETQLADAWERSCLLLQSHTQPQEQSPNPCWIAQRCIHEGPGLRLAKLQRRLWEAFACLPSQFTGLKKSAHNYLQSCEAVMLFSCDVPVADGSEIATTQHWLHLAFQQLDSSMKTGLVVLHREPERDADGFLVVTPGTTMQNGDHMLDAVGFFTAIENMQLNLESDTKITLRWYRLVGDKGCRIFQVKPRRLKVRAMPLKEFTMWMGATAEAALDEEERLAKQRKVDAKAAKEAARAHSGAVGRGRARCRGRGGRGRGRGRHEPELDADDDSLDGEVGLREALCDEPHPVLDEDAHDRSPFDLFFEEEEFADESEALPPTPEATGTPSHVGPSIDSEEDTPDFGPTLAELEEMFTVAAVDDVIAELGEASDDDPSHPPPEPHAEERPEPAKRRRKALAAIDCPGGRIVAYGLPEQYFVAECTRHGDRCRLTRTRIGNEHSPALAARGRPLGLLLAWLGCVPSFVEETVAHVHAWYPSFDERSRERRKLLDRAETDESWRFLLSLERNLRPGELPDEPFLDP